MIIRLQYIIIIGGENVARKDQLCLCTFLTFLAEKGDGHLHTVVWMSPIF